MAVNQQLKDYIDQQLSAGVSREIIKNALLGAGWQERDINEAMTSPVASSSAGAMKPIEIKPIEIKSAEAKPFEIKPMEIKLSDTAPGIQKFPVGSAQQEKHSPVSFVTSDIFQKKNEPMFQSKQSGSQAPLSGERFKPVSGSGETRKGFFQKPLALVIFGVVSLALLAGIGILYAQNSSLQAKFDSADQQRTSLNARINSLTNDKNNLTDQIASLNHTVDDLNSQLSIFVASAGTSTTEASIDIKGTLGGGGKSPYTITTSKSIAVSVKNSRDENINAALKPLIGGKIEISGTHIPGSSVITVTSVNGQSIKPFVQPQSTSTSNASGTLKNTTTTQ